MKLLVNFAYKLDNYLKELNGNNNYLNIEIIEGNFSQKSKSAIYWKLSSVSLVSHYRHLLMIAYCEIG